MASLNACVVFPPKDAFFNDLQQKHIDKTDYENARQLYNSKIASGDWKTMADYMKYYNLLDVVPLLNALQTCFQNYMKFFKIDPMGYLSLPAIGFQAMYSLYDQNLPYVFSFSCVADEVRQLFRDNVVGGLSTVFHR